MQERTLGKLEFDKVRRHLAALTNSALGREIALELKPAIDIDTIRAWLAETSQARELFRLESAAEIGNWHDLRKAILHLERGMIMAAEELFNIGETLAVSRRLKKFLIERTQKYPVLADIATGLAVLPEIEKAILKAILPGGEIADRATPELAQIRRQLVNAQAKVKERLNRIINAPGQRKYLQEALVTMRGDRYVVPVKQENRKMIPGIVHDQSGSGATVFIEPLSVVEANNEVRRLTVVEKQEIQRILTKLSALTAGVTADLTLTVAALGYLDFVFAKANYSRQLNAGQLEISADPKIKLKKARHPLIVGAVVPLDIELGVDFNTLVITGPNTGGKTVALKTTGLMVLMTQAGLHIPVEAGSEIGLFSQVFADIGDQQSIEQSLSTFSAHITNIVAILEQATAGSLVLLDELGSGTDPVEGAALAQAILEHLHHRGVCTVATTHYAELKNFAYTHHGVENASVEFNNETLAPTYKLLTGQPGSSNAFKIAVRLGLPEQTVARARQYLSAEQIKTADLMQKLEQARQQAESERCQAAQIRRDSEKLRIRYQHLEQQLIIRKDKILDKAREEAQAIIKKARQESETTIKELRNKLAEQSTKEREVAIKKAREKLYDLRDKTVDQKIKKALAKTASFQKLQPGDQVFLPQYNNKGYVLNILDHNQVTVQVGILKITVAKDELRLCSSEDTTTSWQQQPQLGKMMRDKVQNINNSLSIRGLKVAEALLKMEKYLDDVSLASLKQVTLIHGKGTGVLRAVVHRELKEHPGVKTFRLGESGEGGDGVTVVEMV